MTEKNEKEVTEVDGNAFMSDICTFSTMLMSRMLKVLSEFRHDVNIDSDDPIGGTKIIVSIFLTLRAFHMDAENWMDNQEIFQKSDPGLKSDVLQFSDAMATGLPEVKRLLSTHNKDEDNDDIWFKVSEVLMKHNRKHHKARKSAASFEEKMKEALNSMNSKERKDENDKDRV